MYEKSHSNPAQTAGKPLTFTTTYGLVSSVYNHSKGTW